MLINYARLVALLLALLAGLIQTREVWPDSGLQQPVEEDEAQLAAVVETLEAENLALAAAGQPRARRAQQKLIRGAVNFFRPFPGGNGRSCATCHVPQDGFSLAPATVEARWQRLQRARRVNPDATDPLFRAIDADDGEGDFTLLRTRALVKVRVPLPQRVKLLADPVATHVTLARAVTPLNMLKHTAPYQQDRSAATLEAQALAAVNQHMEPTAPPTPEFLESVAEFQRHIFSSPGVRRLSAAIDAGAPLPDLDPPLTAFERLGKEKFDDFCGRCHGGPAQVKNLENRIFPPFDGSTNPVSINVVVSNPPPSGFPQSLIHGPEFDLPTFRSKRLRHQWRRAPGGLVTVRARLLLEAECPRAMNDVGRIIAQNVDQGRGEFYVRRIFAEHREWVDRCLKGSSAPSTTRTWDLLVRIPFNRMAREATERMLKAQTLSATPTSDDAADLTGHPDAI